MVAPCTSPETRRRSCEEREPCSDVTDRRGHRHPELAAVRRRAGHQKYAMQSGGRACCKHEPPGCASPAFDDSARNPMLAWLPRCLLAVVVPAALLIAPAEPPLDLGGVREEHLMI